MKKILFLILASPLFAQAQTGFPDLLKTADGSQIITGRIDSVTATTLHFVRKDSPFASLSIPWRQVAGFYAADTNMRKQVCSTTPVCNRMVKHPGDLAMNSLGKVDRAPVELSDSLARIALSYHIYDAGQKLSNAETCTILGVVGYTVGGLLLVKNMSVGNIFIAGGGVLSLSSVILRLKAGRQLKNAGQKIRYLKK
jgi:hypothetical protein